MSEIIYLDNNATTRVADEVLAAMTPFYREHYGNPHAIHSLGRRAHDGVEAARADVAELLGCSASEVIFTSCGTEGNAMVIRGLLDRHPDRRKIVTSAVEHPSVLTLLRAVQPAGKIPISQKELDADFLTISGHKFHAPKGIGALTIRKGIALQPLWYGGGQELGMRSGTEPVPAIVALAAAARLAREALPVYGRVRALRDRLESGIRARVEDTSINGVTQPRLGNTASIAFHDAKADEVVRALDAEGVCVSAGAACHSGSVEPSSTVKAMGIPLRAAMGVVRFSLSRYTTEAEIDRAVEIVGEVLGARMLK